MSKKNGKRILSVTIRRMIDTSPDTSHLGEYATRPANEFAIDRAHAEDCASVREDIRAAKLTLEHVQQTVGDYHNAILAQYNGTLANAKLDAEKEALDEAYDQIGELIDEIDECDCGEHGDARRGEFRYFNGPVENYAGETPEDIRKYVRQDYERMESLNRGDWCYLGIRADAEVTLTQNAGSSVIQRISSGGLWGIESDSDQSYFDEVRRDELASLKTELLALGFSKRAIATAFKNVEEKGE